MRLLLKNNARLIDYLRERFESKSAMGAVSAILFLVFIITIAVIEAGNRGWITPGKSEYIPHTHLAAIELVFTLLLIYEALGLLFSISESISISVGKQFEILSLILLRNTFKIVSHFPEPLSWEGVGEYLPEMGTTITAALIIFFLTQVFYGIAKRYKITTDERELRGFIYSKKLLTSLLLLGFILILVRDTYIKFVLGGEEKIFEEFYTLLIFFDIMMVLISLRYHSGYRISFRNSAYAVSTVIVKLALVAPATYSAAMGVFAMLVAIFATWTYCRFSAAETPTADK